MGVHPMKPSRPIVETKHVVRCPNLNPCDWEIEVPDGAKIGELLDCHANVCPNKIWWSGPPMHMGGPPVHMGGPPPPVHSVSVDG